MGAQYRLSLFVNVILICYCHSLILNYTTFLKLSLCYDSVAHSDDETWTLSSTPIGYIERTSVHWMLCSAHVSVLMIVLTIHFKESENERLLWFWKRTDHWCAFSWASVTRTATLLGILRAMFRRLCWHTQIMGRHQQRGTNSGWKSTWEVAEMQEKYELF
jgi:hypothetical protein